MQTSTLQPQKPEAPEAKDSKTSSFFNPQPQNPSQRSHEPMDCAQDSDDRTPAVGGLMLSFWGCGSSTSTGVVLGLPPGALVT